MKKIKKCKSCGELDYLRDNQKFCEQCLKKQKERNKDILSI